jgi:hypothetical protein
MPIFCFAVLSGIPSMDLDIVAGAILARRSATAEGRPRPKLLVAETGEMDSVGEFTTEETILSISSAISASVCSSSISDASIEPLSDETGEGGVMLCMMARGDVCC